MANNSNNGNMFDPYDFGPIFAQIAQNFGNNGSSLANNEFTQELFQKLDGLFENVNELNKKDINKAFDLVLAMLRSIYGNSSELTNAMKMAKDEVKSMSSKQAISDKLIANIITGAVDRIVHASMQAAQHGEKGALNVANPKDKASADRLAQIFQTQLQKTVDSAVDKVLNFLGTDRQQQKTRMKQFGEDLIEGLAKSKFVGGAITDLIRLATFFAASWLKNFGPLGKALAVGLVALGPIIGTAIANILVKSLTSTLTNVFKVGLLGLGTLLKATILSFTNRELLTSTLRGAPTVARGAISNGNLAVGSFLAATAVGAAAVNTWKEGGTRNKWAGGIMGLGSAAFGTAGIASLLAPLLPALAPIAPIAIAVAAIATGVGLVVKFWPQIMDFFKSILGFLGLIAKKDKDGGYKGGAPTLGEELSGDFRGQKGTVLRSKTKYHPQLSENELAAWKKANETSASVNELGAITNFGQMTQQQAGREMERLRKENPTAWNKLYEYIPFEGVNGKIYGTKDVFKTDLISPDGKGFYMAKGSMERMDKANAFLESQGYAGRMTFSGGIATAGNIETLQASPHRLTGKGHDSPVGAKFDIGQQSINQVVNSKGSRASLSLIDRAIREGWENADISPEGDHRDVYWVSGKVRTEVRENKEAEAQSSKTSIKPKVVEESKETVKQTEDSLKAMNYKMDDAFAKMFPKAAEWRQGIQARVKQNEPDYGGQSTMSSKVLNAPIAISNVAPSAGF